MLPLTICIPSACLPPFTSLSRAQLPVRAGSVVEKHGRGQLPEVTSFSCSIRRLSSCLVSVSESPGKELQLTQLGTAMASVGGGEGPVE